MPAPGALNKKPLYLVTLSNGKKFDQFITIDRPIIETNILQAKGIYVTLSEPEIVLRAAELLTLNKDSVLEMIFPLHRVFSVRNLIFNPNKNR